MCCTCSRSAVVLAARMAPFSAVVSSTLGPLSRSFSRSSSSALLFLKESVCPTSLLLNDSVQGPPSSVCPTDGTTAAAAAVAAAAVAAASAPLSVPSREGGALRSAASRLSARSSGHAHGLSS